MEIPKKKGVMVGRFCPLHVGHERAIRAMFLECGAEQSIIFIGSSNAETSMRMLFPYDVRRDFLLKVFPEAQGRIVGIPDYHGDSRWIIALDDQLSVAGFDPKNTIYYGGCEEDIRFFREVGRECRIVNRFDGTTVKVSATEVRDALVTGRSIEGMVNPIIADEISEAFNNIWQEFKRR